MIIGIGTDLVEKKKLQKIYEKYPKRFSEKILSDCEKNIDSKLSSKKKVDFLCSSFSAKEAYVKALGTGFRGIYPPDITISRDRLGKPNISTKKLNHNKFHLSITNTESYTLSFVVIEK